MDPDKLVVNKEHSPLQEQLFVALSDTLIGVPLGTNNRGEAWDAWVAAFPEWAT